MRIHGWPLQVLDRVLQIFTFFVKDLSLTSVHIYMDITGCLQLYFSGNVNHFHILAFRGLQRLHDILGNGGKLEILGNLSKSIHHVKIPMVMNVIDIQSK